MADKLNLMDQFPDIVLVTTDDATVQIPSDIDTDYAILLFYRGHW